MRFIFIFVGLFLSVTLSAEPCYYLVKASGLKKQQGENSTSYLVDEKDIRKKNDAEFLCFKPIETAEYIRKLEKDAADYQAISKEYQALLEKINTLNQDYKSLIVRHEAALNRSVNLTEEYTRQVEEYNKLVTDYDQLVVKFDELAAGYREVALSTTSFLSFDIGAGATNDKGGMGMLGLGIKLGIVCQQLKLWGVYQKENSGGMIGCSFGF
ncbi:MAG: hypothetical protein MJE63_04485 [Proteobacteria bacterium]|nr:hypothetical protein [Pseudomonadota bacterium]